MKRWLQRLGAGRSRRLSEWLAAHPSPRVCWYPSAGRDFSDLFYLSQAYQVRHPAEPPGVEPAAPQLFLHTDYSSTGVGPLEVGRILDVDGGARVTIEEVEDLPRLDLPLDPRLVRAKATQDTHRVVFLWLRVTGEFGDFERPLIYAFAENAAFCARMLIHDGARARLSHVVCVRHGGGPGGGSATGAWLRQLIHALGAEVFVAEDREDVLESGDAVVFEAFPELAEASRRPSPKLTAFREIQGQLWSDHADWVRWYRVS